jgi:muramoyltetrapeptide carboxypeptidase
VKIKPSPLLPGNTIAVVSPAGPSEPARLQGGIEELMRRGYKVKVGKHAQGRYAFFSGTDEDRLEDLVRAFKDPAIHAIMCSRGGYGSNRLLDSLPYDLIAQNPKIFVGFSDLTALTWALFCKSRLVTFTGPLVNEMGEGLPSMTLDSLFTFLGLDSPPRRLWPGPLTTVRPGEATGPLFPGCLSIVVTLLGSQYLPNLKGAILVLEDIGEKPYHIDRMLTHLKNAGVFNQISGLIMGRMTNCWPRARRNDYLTLAEILLQLTASRPIPIYLDLPYGHHPERLTLPVGVHVRISPNTGLSLLEDPLDRTAVASRSRNLRSKSSQ